MIIYKCDVCGKSIGKDHTIRMVAYRKNRMATKTQDKSIGSKDICMDCYNKVFISAKAIGKLR